MQKMYVHHIASTSICVSPSKNLKGTRDLPSQGGSDECLLDKSTDSDTESETDPNHPSFRNSRRQRPIVRLIYAHNTRIDLPSHFHERSPYFTDSTLVRPTLDKSTDSDTESETDPNHPSFRKSRRWCLNSAFRRC